MSFISTVTELLALINNPSVTGNYTLTNDIDLSDYTISSIQNFTGIFDGNGYSITIKNVSNDYVGFFGNVTGNNSALRNLTLVYSGSGITNTNSVNYFGLFVAYILNNSGEPLADILSNCHLITLNDFMVNVNCQNFGGFCGNFNYSSLGIYQDIVNVNSCSFNAFGNLVIDNSYNDEGVSFLGGFFGNQVCVNTNDINCIFHKDLTINCPNVNYVSFFNGQLYVSKKTNSLVVCKGDITISQNTNNIFFGSVFGITTSSLVENVNGVFNGNISYTNIYNPITDITIGTYSGNIGISYIKNSSIIIAKDTTVNIPNLIVSEDTDIGGFCGGMEQNSSYPITQGMDRCTALFGGFVSIPGTEFIGDIDGNPDITDCTAIYNDYTLRTLGPILLGVKVIGEQRIGSVGPILPTGPLSDITNIWNASSATSWLNDILYMRNSWALDIENPAPYETYIENIYKDTAYPSSVDARIYSILNAAEFNPAFMNSNPMIFSNELSLSAVKPEGLVLYELTPEYTIQNFDTYPYQYFPTETGIVISNGTETPYVVKDGNNNVNFYGTLGEVSKMLPGSSGVILQTRNDTNAFILIGKDTTPPVKVSLSMSVIDYIVIFIGVILIVVVLIFVIKEYAILNRIRF
jgi:hypothetical protein